MYQVNFGYQIFNLSFALISQFHHCSRDTSYELRYLMEKKKFVTSSSKSNTLFFLFFIEKTNKNLGHGGGRPSKWVRKKINVCVCSDALELFKRLPRRSTIATSSAHCVSHSNSRRIDMWRSVHGGTFALTPPNQQWQTLAFFFLSFFKIRSWHPCALHIFLIKVSSDIGSWATYENSLKKCNFRRD